MVTVPHSAYPSRKPGAGARKLSSNLRDRLPAPANAQMHCLRLGLCGEKADMGVSYFLAALTSSLPTPPHPAPLFHQLDEGWMGLLHA